MATKIRSQKLFLNVLDNRFGDRKQTSILSLLTNGNQIFSNNYAKVFTQDEIGSFDIVNSGGTNNLQFFPIDGRINEYNYSFFSYETKQLITDTDSYNLGDIVSIGSSNKTFSSGNPETISQISADFTSSKILVELSTSNNFYEYKEFNIIVNSNNEILLSDYGTICFDNDSSISGLGTYDVYVSGSNINLDFYPDDSSLGNISANVINVSFANTNFSQEGSLNLRSGNIESNKTSILASPSPSPTIVSSYDSNYQSSYAIAQVTDLDSGNIQFSELIVINDSGETYSIEYGNVETQNSLGSFSTNLSSTTDILFTPNPNTNVEVVIYQNKLTYFEFTNFSPSLNLKNVELKTGVSVFGSQDRTEFDLKYKGDFIFEKLFNGSLSSVVNVNEDYITIPNHFFVTGEQVNYRSQQLDQDSTDNSIGIANTVITGVGLTNKLSGELYIYKVDETRIKFASSAQNALSATPNLIDITSVGVGITHYITSTKQNRKCIIAIDNVIQSPIVVSSSTSSILQNSIDNGSDNILTFSGISSFSSGNLIKIDDEILKINSIGIGNSVDVDRGFLGTGISSHLSNSIIRKVEGNYNIIGSKIYFASPPYGETKGDPNEFGSVITENTIKSSFHGRVFIRSGIPDGNSETYNRNYLFDDISSSFNSANKDFVLTSNQQNVFGISTDRSITLINNVLQIPDDDFTLTENLAGTEISFTGTATSVSYDPNNASVPRGGIPISIGSSNGLGYQPLVSAGGTAIVSISGTISTISIGNSGSGYRSGIQTNIRVGVQTYSSGIPNIEFIGNAIVSNGNIVSVNITNPGSGYDQLNPPDVVFDPPLSYSDIPLIYSPSYPSGVGTEAKIDIVVGQGSSVVSFEIKNYGYSYLPGEILTVETGGSTGIPLDPSKSFEEFSILIDNVTKDNFSGWFVGNLKLLDDFSFRFDGLRKTFTLRDDGNIFSIITKKGSNIDVKATILVILNDVIQIPNESYIFNGGSNITFTEAPKEGDECKILFYRGTDGIDVIDVDIEETIKVGDILNIDSEDSNTDQKNRIVNVITSPTSVDTNLYSSVGVSSDLDLLRPITWCKQRNDIKINNADVTKDRIEYEPKINPVGNLIKGVGIGSTMIFVDSLKSFFDYKNENSSDSYISKIEIVDVKENIVAISTALVSVAGTISSIDITNNGLGYDFIPEVSITSPIGIGSTGKATATASISSGVVTSIQIVNPGFGYTVSSPPLVIIESPKVKKEQISNVTYSGDYGIITGVSTISVGYAQTGIVFDLLIPRDSPLRNSAFTNPTVTESGIKESYYLNVFNTNIGNGLVSLDSGGSIISVGTRFMDNIYQVASVSIVPVTGVYGYENFVTVNVARVVVSVQDYNLLGDLGSNRFFGEFSWGLIETKSRPQEREFIVGTSYQNSGLTTAPIVRRTNPLKFNSYTII